MTERLTKSLLAQTVFQEDFFGEWTKNIPHLKKEFLNNQPYPHIIIDNFFSKDFAEKIVSVFPNNEWEGWFSYYNPIEIKKACDDLEKLNPLLRDVFYQLNCDDFIQKMRDLTDIQNLEYDPFLHGGGLHSIPRNGKLNLHLDYSIHPLSGKERRINIIIYLNKNWKEEWDGNLELWDKELTACQKSVLPLFNRAAIFQTFDESWHGHPQTLKCPHSESRKSLAVYYVSNPRENASLRKKAHFIQTPHTQHDERIQKLLDIRDFRRIEQEDIINIFPDWENVCFSECSRD